MKVEVNEIISQATTPSLRGALVREYLQARILESLQQSGAMTAIAFQGGTALRFLYSLPRFSEDLDFALERSADAFALKSWMEDLKRTLYAEGYELDYKLKERGAAHAATVRFVGLLHELGLAVHRNQVLTIKVEIDTRPPAGAKLETTLVRCHRILNLHHHDQGSLLAGKIHAILRRDHAKGRDVYDLLWYLSDPHWPFPNLDLLQNALTQTAKSTPQVRPEDWRSLVADRIGAFDWVELHRDVAPFLERSADLDLMTKENLLKLLRR